MALNKAKVITVTSVKGGSGKTTTVLNIAGILSDMHKKTVIVDLDLYSGSIGASLNVNGETDIYTLCEDMMNNRFGQLEDYTQKYNDYIDVLTAPIDPRSVSKIRAKFIEILISRLILKYDVILIDTNHIIDQINVVTLDYSDEILSVITNDLMDFKCMKPMVAIFKDMDRHNYKIILNEARPNNTSYSPYEIKNMIGSNIDYVLPKSFYNKNIEKFVYNGKIMTLDKNIAHSKGGQVLTEIVTKALKEE